MIFKSRRRVYPVDILRTDYEYCIISYYTKGERNELGEPSRVLLQRAFNIKCSIDPITKLPRNIQQAALRDILQQGIIERRAYIMTILANQAIEPGDIVTDYDNVNYDVLQVINWYSHKEVYLRKLN